MLQDDGLKQFEYLLLDIIKYASLNFPCKEVCNLAFYTTSKNFNITNQTVRDLVTRRCNSKIADFHTSICALYNHDASFFKAKYYSSIPRSYHQKFDLICKKFDEVCYVEEKVNPAMLTVLKKFIRFNDDDKWKFIQDLQERIDKS